MSILYKTLITYEGCHCVLESDPYESRDRFHKRAIFIVKYINNKNKNFDNIEYVKVKSRMWINSQIYDAEY